jgi:hypothetical protein
VPAPRGGRHPRRRQAGPAGRSRRDPCAEVNLGKGGG